jgi:hypothetical protein
LAFASDHCFERRSSVPVKVFLSEALRFGVGQFDVADVWHDLEADGRFTADIDGRLFVASREVLDEEQRLVQLAAEGRASVPALNPDHVVQDERLNQGQRDAVHHLLTSRDRISLVIGDAGVGKTTALTEAVLGAAREGASDAGLRVTALAPSAAASRINLRAEGFPEAETVAKFLADPELQDSARGQIILVDEAAMVGTKDMAKLAGLAKELDARLWLVGDDKQHQSIARGSSFALLQEKAGLQPARITEIQRQKGTYLKVVELARDQPRAALEKLFELGEVREIATSERYLLLANDYLDATRLPGRDGKASTALVIAPTHAEGKRVTGQIRGCLRAEGRLGEERHMLQLEPLHLTQAQRSDDLSYEQGDVLQYLQNAPGHKRGERLVVGKVKQLPLSQAAKFQAFRAATLDVAIGDRLRVTNNGATLDGHRLNNGETFTVRGFTPSGDLIDHRGWKVAKDFGHLAHGYCTTSFSAQSRTVDRVLVAMGTQSLPAVSREQLYVSLSRGREWARVYTDDREALGKAVGRSDERLSATEVAAKQKAQQLRVASLRRHVAFLQRLERRSADRWPAPVDRLGQYLPDNREIRRVANER